MRHRLLFLLFVVVSALALAACGGGGHPKVHVAATAKPVLQRPRAAEIPSKCPTNRAEMGCSVQAVPNLIRGAQLALPRLPLFPDVSVFQGAVNWLAVAVWQRSHGWHPEAIFKMGEFTLDVQAERNASLTRALGFYRAGYWFLRNTGCVHEAGLIVWAARLLGLKVVVLDSEVPEARGYAACLSPRLRAAGLVPVEYTSSGSNPDGSANPGLPVWAAAYGPSHPPCVFTCVVGVSGRQSIVAWQMTDGQFGPVVSIPGIGRGDVSIDYSIGKLIAGATASTAVVKPKPKPKPKGVDIGGAQHYERFPVAERSAVQAWDRLRCENPVRRPACVSDRRRLVKLLAADRKLHGTADYLPGRVASISARVSRRPGVVRSFQ